MSVVAMARCSALSYTAPLDSEASSLIAQRWPRARNGISRRPGCSTAARWWAGTCSLRYRVQPTRHEEAKHHAHEALTIMGRGEPARTDGGSEQRLTRAWS